MKRGRGSGGKWWFRTAVRAAIIVIPLHVVAALGCDYPLARVYLVVEAVVSLRDVPLELYIAPECWRYLVHSRRVRWGYRDADRQDTGDG